MQQNCIDIGKHRQLNRDQLLQRRKNWLRTESETNIRSVPMMRLRCGMGTEGTEVPGNDISIDGEEKIIFIPFLSSLCLTLTPLFII
jgi:hypothetical protein